MDWRIGSIALLFILLPAAACKDKREGGPSFSCRTNGTLVSVSGDPGLFNPLMDVITVTGETEKYVTGIRIPKDIQAGQKCDGCKAFVLEKIVRESGVEERRIYEFTKAISVNITARRGNHLEGAFSFIVKVKEDGDREIAVTDGSFVTDLQ